jgi:DNA repair protein RadD
MRPAPGKDMAYVLDHAGNTLKHGLPTADRQWSLHGKQQVQDAEVSKLMRCKACGAVNLRTAEFCESCGAELHERRPDLVEIPGGRLTKALDLDNIMPSTMQICSWSYREAIRWARNDRKRLELVAEAKGYKPGWVWHVMRGD